MLDSWLGLNLTLYSVEIDRSRGYTAEQLSPKQIDPTTTSG